MPVGGKLVLKGGETLPVEKKIKKKAAKKDVTNVPEGEQAGAGTSGGDKQAGPGISVQSGKNYEDEFEFEKQRMHQATQGKVMTKSVPWGSSYRAAPEILHGYTKKVTGKTAEERLDMRAATKSDKFAK